MPEKILGIDIDDDFLNAVLVYRDIRGGSRVADAVRINLATDGGMSGAIGELRGKIDLQQVRINVSLPAKIISFHNVRLPFKEEKKIRQTIGFELEAVLPDGIEDYLFGYHVAGGGNSGEVLAALVPRSAIVEKLSLLGENTNDVNYLQIDALPMASWLMANGAVDSSSIILDMHKDGAVAVFVRQGEIILVRHFALDVAFADGVSRAAGNEDAFSEGLRRFCRDLKNTVEFMKWRGVIEGDPGQIIISGEGAQNTHFRDELENYFHMPVKTADVASLGGIRLPDGIGEGWNPETMNRALALAASKTDGKLFSFSPRALAAKKKTEGFGKIFKWGTAVAAVLVLFVMTDAYLDYSYSRLRLENLKKRINAVFKNAAPEVTRIVDPVQQFKARIEELKKVPLTRISSDGGVKVLDMLQDISNLTPPTAEFMMTSFNFAEDQLSIRGTAKNFESVDVIKKELGKSKYFESVQIGTTSPAKQGDRVEFDLKVTIQK